MFFIYVIYDNCSYNPTGCFVYIYNEIRLMFPLCSTKGGLSHLDYTSWIIHYKNLNYGLANAWSISETISGKNLCKKNLPSPTTQLNNLPHTSLGVGFMLAASGLESSLVLTIFKGKL